MKYLFLIPLFLCSSAVTAQNVQVTPTGNSADNNAQTFTFDRSNLQVSGNNLAVTGPAGQINIPNVSSFDISGEGKFLGTILIENNLRARLFDGLGKKVQDVELDYFDPFDETLKIKVYNDGRFITRDNVANFSFFDSNGSLRYNVSNSSGSPDGEVASGIATDPTGNTILLYNPRINYGNQEGSRARILKGENDFKKLHSSRERTIKYAKVSSRGSYITVITERAGTDDQVIITDRHGNEIEKLSTDMELLGATLTEDARYLTLYSSGRAQVLRLKDGEVLGSTSFRSTVAYASYIPEDQQIVALCGIINNNRQIQNPEIHAIHLGERSIARTEVAFPLSKPDHNRLEISNTGINQFRLTGLNRELHIQTQF
jgi:hypothetical protein